MMLTLRDAALAMSGELAATGEHAFNRVTTDSRDVRPGDLFFALKGERFDGHDFVTQVLEQGAVAAVTCVPGPGARIVVGDTLAALGALAAAWRGRFPATPLVAITGSNGKTTVKEMTAAILAQYVGAEHVHATAGNLNNHIGLPLTLLGMRAGCRFVVAEMGMNHFGEISHLTHLAHPDVAVITNAGNAHLEMLGSIEGVARAKGEIFEGLQPWGSAVINADDAQAELWTKLAAGYRQQTFGLRAAEISAHSIISNTDGSRFVLQTPSGDALVKIHVPGLHNVRNALAAAAATFELQVPLDVIAQGLESYQGVKGRLEVKAAHNGAVLIDDTYNANPDSMRAAIDVLAERGGKTVLVLGDMGEVGSDAPQRHAEVGAYAKEKEIAVFYTLGEQMVHATQAGGGRHFASLDELVYALREVVTPDAVVLVKGSRFMKMERVVKALQEGVSCC
ncbi:MAG: UDP-N-acetylmuramoyl-tripeptide--D-alanyl-D-alanine ligase [Formivibrio sp.]|nr:UDP-N-acetylmuramoyl-tripeptide--D-alanyl-D-alanine ligase [Formivibrio sp.]